MRQYSAGLDNLKLPLSRFEVAIEWLLVGLLAFMPLAFGVVHAWSEEVVIALSGAMAVCFLLRLIFRPEAHLVRTWAYVPIAAFIFISLFQLVPLPRWLVAVISPNTVRLKTELLADLANAGTKLDLMTLSFYPDATIHDLRLVLAIAAVFVVALNVFRRPEQIARLLTAIAAIGGVIAVITLAQNIFGNGRIYWFISSKNCRGYSGPFVNHSNYGQFMNLSIGAVLGLFMVKLQTALAGKRVTLRTVVGCLSSNSAKTLWLLIVVMALGAATIFISLTRGGVLSMLIAIAFTTLLFCLHRAHRGHAWVVVVIALVAFTCVLYVGFDTVYDRLASLRDFRGADAGRLQILKDIAVMWTRFPLWGTGLGTHSVVYPMFDRSTIPQLAAHAENEYAQALEETGAAGLSVLIVFGVIIWSNYAGTIRSAGLPVCAAAYGLGFGILAILVHSLSDFGQHLPANAILSAVFCALLITLAEREQRVLPQHTGGRARLCKIVLNSAILAGALAAYLWALGGADNARVAEAYWMKCRDTERVLADRERQGTDEEYADLISYATAACEHQPGNIRYRHWLNVCRWRSISRLADPNSGQVVIADGLMPAVRDVVADFHQARLLCPTYGAACSVVGQIEKFVLNDDSGAERIRMGFRLSPCDPISCFVAGYLDVVEGRDDDCVPKLERAVQLDGRLFRDVVGIYVNYLSRPHLAISAAGDDIERLRHVAGVLEEMQYGDLAEQTIDKIKNLLEAKCSGDNASAAEFALLGDIHRRRGGDEAAIQCYRRALVMDYGRVEWRLELARLLVRARRMPDAMREAKICLHLRPESKVAEELVANLSVSPAAFDEEIVLPK